MLVLDSGSISFRLIRRGLLVLLPVPSRRLLVPVLLGS